MSILNMLLYYTIYYTIYYSIYILLYRRIQGRDEKEKQTVKLMVFTVEQLVRHRVGDGGRKLSGEVGPRMEGRGRETREWQTWKATCVAT